ncbi:MAG: CoA-binding protein [Myxococcota bacterium]|nr:CoA-binding protein [Myxococcota bacterium]
MDHEAEQIAQFLKSPSFGVVGASQDRTKYGNKVLRCYLQHGHSVVAINPRGGRIEKQPTFENVRGLPPEIQSLSLITPPHISEEVIQEAAQGHIRNIWLQPGAESPRCLEICQAHGINVIAGGACLLVVLGYRDHYEP